MCATTEPMAPVWGFSMIRQVLWDFNGTLLDDVELCRSILNGMLTSRGIAAVDYARYREIFGFPVRDYYIRAGLDLSRYSFEELAQQYILQYQPRSLSLPLCPGAMEALTYLKNANIQQNILSASKCSLLAEQLDSLKIGHWFCDVLGIDDIYAHGKAEVGARWMTRQNTDPRSVLLIGDTAHDGQVASAIGCRCVLVAAGHYSRPRLEETGWPVLDTLHDLQAWMESTEHAMDL